MAKVMLLNLPLQIVQAFLDFRGFDFRDFQFTVV